MLRTWLVVDCVEVEICFMLDDIFSHGARFNVGHSKTSKTVEAHNLVKGHVPLSLRVCPSHSRGESLGARSFRGVLSTVVVLLVGWSFSHGVLD